MKTGQIKKKWEVKGMDENEFYKKIIQFLNFGELDSAREEDELSVALRGAKLADMQSVVDAINRREKTQPQFITISTPWGFRYRAWMWKEGTEKKIFVYLPFEYLTKVSWGCKYTFVMGILDGFRISGEWHYLQLDGE